MWFSLRMPQSYPHNRVPRVMSFDTSNRSQRPYRYGMVLLCVGALINWLGLAENYVEPVRYIGVACIIAGALLICTAMCFWLHSSSNREMNQTSPLDPRQSEHDSIHVINVDSPTCTQKPPDYDSVAGAPPSYDDAIKLDPSQLIQCSTSSNQTHVHTLISNPGSSQEIPNIRHDIPGSLRPPDSPPPAYNALGNR